MKLEILQILEAAIIQLQTYSLSLKNTESAYIDYITLYLKNYFTNNKLDYLIQNDFKINEKYSIDIIILNKQNDIIAVVDCIKLTHYNEKLIQNDLNKLTNYDLEEKTDIFHIIFDETKKNYWSSYSTLAMLLNFDIKVRKNSKPNLFIARSNTAYSKNSYYHLYANFFKENITGISQTKIETIQLYNFKLFESLVITFSPSVNIFLGKNGAGKTTILQALALANLPEYANNIKYSSFIKQNCDVSEIAIKRANEKEIRITVDVNKKNIETNFYREPIFLAFGPNIFSKTSRQDYDTIVESLIKGTSEWYYVNSLFKDFDDELIEPLGILRKLSESENPIALSIFELLKSKLQTFLTEYTIGKKDVGTSYYFVDNNGNYLETYQLSEGYRTMLLLLSDIMVRIIGLRQTIEISAIFDKTKGVVAIDEFDRHLHPAWQRKFVSDIKNTFPNIQFFLTTHNPFSVQSAIGGNAIQLITDNGIIVAKSSTIEIKNILSVIKEYFTKEFFDYETQNILIQFSNYLDRIDEGEIELVYSVDFKTIVKQIYDKGDELESIVANQIIQLNNTLKNLNKKEFEL